MRVSLLNRSESYMHGVNERLDEVFKLPEGRSAIQRNIVRWIRNEAKDGDGGYANIREAVTSNSEFTKVLYHWPTQLLGLPHDQRLDFVSRVIKVWSPKSFDSMERSEILRERR